MREHQTQRIRIDRTGKVDAQPAPFNLDHPIVGAAAGSAVALAGLPSSGKPVRKAGVSSMRIGTNTSSAPRAARSAARRHVSSRPRLMPRKRAIPRRSPQAATLGNHRRLLRRAPAPAPRSPRDQLNPPILAAFVPVLMPGTITGAFHSHHPTDRSQVRSLPVCSLAPLGGGLASVTLKQHRIRRLDAETALGILRQPAIKVAAGVTEAAVLHLRSLIARLRLTNQELRAAEDKLDEICAELGRPADTGGGSAPTDAAVLRSLPGVGRSTLAVLLTEAAGPLARRDYAALRTLSGVAPVTKRSGKTCIVTMRYAAQARLRQAVFHWARAAVQKIHEPQPLRCPARTRSLLRPRPTRCRRPAARSRPASCCSGKHCSTPSTVHRRRRKQASLGSTAAAIPSPRPVSRQSTARKRCPGDRAAAPAHFAPARSVLDGASTVLRFGGSGWPTLAT